jgi:hypothetical protein
MMKIASIHYFFYLGERAKIGISEQADETISAPGRRMALI